MFDGVVEEGLAEEAKLFGVVGYEELIMGEVRRGVEEIFFSEEGARFLRASERGVDQLNIGAEFVLDDRLQRG